jgi:hypothetical protein
MTSLGSPVESKASSLASSSYTGGGSLVSTTYATASFISSQVNPFFNTYTHIYFYDGARAHLHFPSLRNGIIRVYCFALLLLLRSELNEKLCVCEFP